MKPGTGARKPRRPKRTNDGAVLPQGAPVEPERPAPRPEQDEAVDPDETPPMPFPAVQQR